MSLGHYRCFGCGEIRFDYTPDYSEPFLCEKCIEKLWQIYAKDCENRERTLRDFMKNKVSNELVEALEAGLRGLVWFIEGPYGHSPTAEDLKNVRAVLKKYSTE